MVIEDTHTHTLAGTLEVNEFKITFKLTTDL